MLTTTGNPERSLRGVEPRLAELGVTKVPIVDGQEINMFFMFLSVSWSSRLRHCAATESSCALFPEMLLTSATRTGMEGVTRWMDGWVSRRGRDYNRDELGNNKCALN